MRIAFSLVLLAVGIAAVDGSPKVAIHELADGSLLEGSIRRSGESVRILTTFGERVVPAGQYRGVSRTSLGELAARYEAMLSDVARKDAAQHRAVATWSRKNGYLTGLRSRLNHLLGLEVDDPWARKQVSELARTFTVDARENPQRGRDRRKFVDFLFERLAVKDNVGAVMAVEKARHLDKDLTFRPAMKAMKKGKPRVRWAGAHVLSLHVDEPLRISPLYKQSLRDGIWAVRREAVRALKSTGDEAFVRLYARHLRSPESMLRVRAAQALAELGMSEGMQPLIAALADTWRPVRNFVAVTSQVSYVKDYDVEVAQTAFIADPVVDVLQDGAVLETAIVHVQAERRLYRDALRRLSGTNLGDRPGAWRRWLDGQESRPR